MLRQLRCYAMIRADAYAAAAAAYARSAIFAAIAGYAADYARHAMLI